MGLGLYLFLAAPRGNLAKPALCLIGRFKLLLFFKPEGAIEIFLDVLDALLRVETGGVVNDA